MPTGLCFFLFFFVSFSSCVNPVSEKERKMATRYSQMLPHEQFSNVPGNHISTISMKRLKYLNSECPYASHPGNVFLYHATEPVIRMAVFVESSEAESGEILQEFNPMQIKNYISFLGDDEKALKKFFGKAERRDRTMDDLCLVIDFIANEKSAVDQ